VDELLDRIAATPEDQELEVLRIYADQLIERGDPHGELIVVATQRLAIDTPELRRREEALISQREAALTRALARPTPTLFRWRRGFIDTVGFSHGGDERLELALPALAAEPAARLVRRIVIDTVQFDGRGDLGPVFAELARLAPTFPRLTELVIEQGPNFGNPWVDGPIDLNDVTPIYAAYPRLEVLELDGDHLELGTVALPSLRRFLATHLRVEDARRIVAAQLPSLVELELAFRYGRVVENVAATFGPLLHREFPKLEALSLAMPTTEATQWMVRELATSPLGHRVRRLAFRHGKLDEASLFALIAEAPMFRRLERVELYERTLSATLQKRLVETFGRRLALV
jgi:hypothetical protein